MIEIPSVLKQDGFRFILVRGKSKNPVELAWSTENNYAWDDPKLQVHLARDGNYGIVGGFGNFVALDFDNVETYSKLFDTEKLESAFPVVRTGSGKQHVYARTPEPQRSFRIPQIHLEVRGAGNFVVGPNCVHPCGNRYELINTISEIPVVNDLESAVWANAKAKFGIDKSPQSQGTLTPVNFTGEFMGLPCIRVLFQIKLTHGRRVHASKLLGIAWVRDHGGVDGFAPVAQRFADFQNHPDFPMSWREVYAWAQSAMRNKRDWNCGEMIMLYRQNQIFPTCSGCPMKTEVR